MTTVYIRAQYGNRDRYRSGMNVPFGLLFSWYLRLKDIPLRGRILLMNGRRRIRFDETPKCLGFVRDGHHEIISVNLLMFFDLDDLEHQNDYPLTIGNQREGVLNVQTMRDAINASIQAGHVAEVVPQGDGLLPPPHKRYCMQERYET